MRFQILIYDGFDELDAIAPFEVLHNAELAKTDAVVELVTAEAAKEIIGAHGLHLRPSVQLNLEQQPDVLVVPGGGWAASSIKGARAEVERGVIPTIIKSLHESGTILAAVCTGAMLLASSGILRGRPAITYHNAITDLQAAGAKIVRARVVDDGNIITAGGVTSGLDLALWLVERFYGSKTAQEIETKMEYERRGTVWRNENRKDCKTLN
jgi:transcriptional regulator GlxA family with amidase domain